MGYPTWSGYLTYLGSPISMKTGSKCNSSSCTWKKKQYKWHFLLWFPKTLIHSAPHWFKVILGKLVYIFLHFYVFFRLPQSELKEEDEEPTYAQPVRTRPVKYECHEVYSCYCNLWNSTNAVPLIPSIFSCLSHPPHPHPLPAVPAVGWGERQLCS